jgi:hypothetical protein
MHIYIYIYIYIYIWRLFYSRRRFPLFPSVTFFSAVPCFHCFLYIVSLAQSRTASFTLLLWLLCLHFPWPSRILRSVTVSRPYWLSFPHHVYMSFSISTISLIVSFRILSNLVLLLLFKQPISVANSLLLFLLLTYHAPAPCIITLCTIVLQILFFVIFHRLSHKTEFTDLIMFLPLFTLLFISSLPWPFLLKRTSEYLHLSAPFT